MIIVFHTPVVSGFQLIEQAWPSMKTSPGPGLVGSGSACTNIAADEAKTVNARAASIFFFLYERTWRLLKMKDYGQDDWGDSENSKRVTGEVI